MNQFRKILRFELKNYLSNKIFVGVTVFLLILIAGVSFFPRLKEGFSAIVPDSHESDESLPLMLYPYMVGLQGLEPRTNRL